MGRDPGYPDDIHQYDDDPRSPFYDESKQYNEEAEATRGDEEYQRMKDKQLDEKWEKQNEQEKT